MTNVLAIDQGTSGTKAIVADGAGQVLLRTRHRRRDPRRLRLRHSLRGPAYARRLTAMASDAGAALQATATVTGWAGDRTLEITSPAGRRRTGRWRGSPA